VLRYAAATPSACRAVQTVLVQGTSLLRCAAPVCRSRWPREDHRLARNHSQPPPASYRRRRLLTTSSARVGSERLLFQTASGRSQLTPRVAAPRPSVALDFARVK